MKEKTFFLKPFQQKDISPEIRIGGKINRDIGRLAILYELSGPLKELMIPLASERPARMNRLWEDTCFELFLNSQNSDAYWEFNLSPSGDWNIYRFNDYRQGMREENAFADLPYSVRTGPEILGLALEFNTEKIIPADQAVNVAICAVLKSISDGTTYWALAHQGNKPDFHRKDGFMIEL